MELSVFIGDEKLQEFYRRLTLMKSPEIFADEEKMRGFMDAIVIPRRCRPYSAPPAGETSRTAGAEN